MTIFDVAHSARLCGGTLMRRQNGSWYCECGTVLELGEDAKPIVSIRARGGRPNERVVIVDGSEVHRCVMTGSDQPDSF